MPGNIFITIGFVLAGLALIGWLVSSPDKIIAFRAWLKNLRSTASRSQTELEALKGDIQGTNRVPDSAPKEQQFLDLKLSETVQFSPDSSKVINRPELGASGIGAFHALNNLGHGQFEPRGEDWFTITFDNTFQLIFRPEGWYCFDASLVITLDPEGTDIFTREGLVFCDPAHHQQARSHSFTWNQRKLTILDVGYVEVEVQSGDLFGIPPGMNIKYMLCESKDGFVFVENRKAGVDRVWTEGKLLGPSITPYIGRLNRVV